jgi:hypothetical protein
MATQSPWGEKRRPQKTWEIHFTGVFSRVGWSEAEARSNAEEFLDKLVVVRDAKITKIIPESGF